MTYEDLIVLMPSHSLEDFPTELPDDVAANLLNCWAAAWHPLLLANAGVLPRWHRADDPPELVERRLILLPNKCKDQVPSGWVERARREGGVVVTDLTERDRLIAAALEPLERTEQVDRDLAADFLALGFCCLQIELLTRHMRHFSNLDEMHLQREAVAAAKAAISGDEAAARTRLRDCFEVLTEARERFYPVDCYLVDICLLIPRLADQHLRQALTSLKPVNVLVSGEGLEEIARDSPDILASLREAWQRRTAEPIGGEYREAPTPLLPLESVLWQFASGRAAFRRCLGRAPTIWGRRRYGLFPQLPQILERFAFQAALHLAMDDGLYPDAEYSKIRWEGTGGSVIEAMSRIPLAADGANSYLRFPARMAESMDHDQVAMVVFARWPEVKAPWFDDLRRMHNYSPVLGRWVTLDDFFQHTDSAGRIASHQATEYLSPFLVQSVARQEADPISRYADHFRRRHQYDAAAWMRGLSAAVLGRPVPADAETEQLVETGGPDGATEQRESADARLREFSAESARGLADLVLAESGSEAGYLLVNPLSFSRTVSVSLPELVDPPAIEGAVKFVQWDESRKIVTVEIPGSAFLWLPRRAAASSARPHRRPAVPLAEHNLLRNEFFEVHLNEQTGGIGQIKGHGRSPNRLSHQLALRFPWERKVVQGDEEIRTYYSRMRVVSSEVTCPGPSLGEIVTTGDILDPSNDERLAGYRQTYRVWRGRPVVELQIELELDQLPDGSPWTNYYAARFAWNDSAASVTRSLLMTAQPIRDDRFESPHYLEIATESQRTTILNLGLPFHRKTGDRMVDTLLVTAGETRRKFSFVIAVDESYPMQAALDALSPVVVIPTQQGPPRVGRSGWFFHLDARNVQLTRILGLLEEPAEPTDAWDTSDREEQVSGRGFAVRLVETEGRPVRVHLRCFKTPTRARQRNFEGRTITDLSIAGDAVVVDLTANEIADVEVRFEG